jgi:quercetin dioxygenase-like cupin family protein
MIVAESKQSECKLPEDDLNRALTVAQPDQSDLPHIGLVGDTYTINVSGKDTNGRFCVIDMHVPHGGGPGPHRHDYEETFIVLAGQIEVTFRGEVKQVHIGETVNIPSNAPHQFHNVAAEPARLLCICSPAGLEEFFEALGVRVATRTTPPPALTPEQQAAFLKKATELASRYQTEILSHA